MAVKRKFILLNTCIFSYHGNPEEIKNELIMLSQIGRMVELKGGFTRIFNVKGDFVCNTTISIEQILEKTKNPIELTM